MLKIHYLIIVVLCETGTIQCSALEFCTVIKLFRNNNVRSYSNIGHPPYVHQREIVRRELSFTDLGLDFYLAFYYKY
jgi:hypothetical protein